MRDQLCARFDACLAKMSGRRKHNEGRAQAEIGAHLEQHLGALQTQLQLAVRMKEFDIAFELEENVRQVQEELASFKKQQALLNDSAELAHAELLRMKVAKRRRRRRRGWGRRVSGGEAAEGAEQGRQRRGTSSFRAHL